MEIFRLFGSIFIENEKANKSLRDTEKQATDVGKTLQETTKAAIKFGDELGKRLTDVGSKMTKVAGIPLAALKAAMLGLAKTTADYGDRVAKASQEIGLSVEAYQELEYALGQNGVATEQFEMAIGNLNRRLGEARRGNAKYRETLKQMGFSLDDLDKGAVTTEESFMQIVEALSQMDDAQMQASLASEFFGNRVARKLMPAIRGGSEAIEELRKRAHDLGIVMDEEAARKSELFGDTMDDLGRAMGGFSRTIGSELQAPLINIAKWFTDIVAGASKWIKENPKLVRQVVMFGGAIAGVLGVLVTLGTTMIVTGKIIGALGAIFNILTSKPVLIIAAIGALYLAWTNDWLGIRTAVEDAWEVIGPIVDAIIKWGKEKLETTWNWTTENLPKFLKWISETAWPWFNDKVSTAWNWTTGTISAFVTWVKETAWPFIDGVATTTWNWSRGKVGDFITWIKEVAWPFIDGVATTTWNWVEGEAVPAVVKAGKAVINAVVEVSGKVYDAIKKGFETGDWADFWDITSDLWSKGVVIGITLSQFVKGFSAVINAIRRGLGLAAAAGAGLAGLGIPGLIGLLSVGIQLVEAQAEGSYEEFARNVIVAGLASVLGATVGGGPGAMLAFNVAVNLKLGNLTGFELLWDWISYNLEKIFSLKFGEMMSLSAFSKEWAKRKVREEMGIAPDAPSDAEIYTGEKLLLQTIEEHAIKNSARVGAGIDNVERLTEELSRLDKQALIVAETLKQGGTIEQALALLGIAYWETRGYGGYAHTDPTTGEVIRGGAGEYGIGQVMPETGKDVWTRLWKQPAETWDESMLEDLNTNIAMMVSYFLDRYQAYGEDLRLAIEGYNRGTAIDGMQAYTVGVVEWMEGAEGQSLANILYDGMENALEAMVQAGYDMDGDVREMAAFIAQSIADYLVGQSPPPKGPLSDIDKGGQNVIEAWTEGAKTALDEGTPKLISALDRIKGMFAAIWEKIPDDVKEPIEQALTWITGLIEQAEEALFNLDEFQEELDALMGGGASPEEQAQGFMTRLIDGLNEKLDKLDEPMNRFTDAIFSAGRSTLEFGKALLSGNWIDALLTIIMETESFAKAMELLGAVLDPVIALFDAVLAPIINFLLKLWNGIIDALSKISIFGWKPFGGLADKKIGLVGEGDGSGGSSGGRQVSEITGPTRDLLVDLLSPLANFGQIVAPIQDIRDILDQRLPNFNAFGMEFAAAGAGAMSPAVVIENLNVTAPTTGVDDISRATIDQIERALAGRIAFGQRGRGGR